MFKEMAHILYGSFIWNILRMRLCIHDKKVVVILTGENKKLDYYAIVYLADLMKRKYANEAVIFIDNKETCKMIKAMKPPVALKIYRYPRDKMEKLYSYYSFYKFSDRVVFTYTDRPKDNQLGKALRETAINERDAVCLGLYHLRAVLEKEDKI